MILYNYDLDDNCYRVRLLAAVAGVELPLQGLDIFPGKDHLTPDMLARNPAGALPVLEEGAVVLTSVPAIFTYLSDKAGGVFQPQDAGAKAQMIEWLTFAAGDLAAASKARAISLMAVPGDLEAERAKARAALRRMEDAMTRITLTGGGFFAGDTVSLADLALFPAFALSRDFGIDHDEFPALRLWARRVRLTPGFITMPGIPDYH